MNPPRVAAKRLRVDYDAQTQADHWHLAQRIRVLSPERCRALVSLVNCIALEDAIAEAQEAQGASEQLRQGHQIDQLLDVEGGRRLMRRKGER